MQNICLYDYFVNARMDASVYTCSVIIYIYVYICVYIYIYVYLCILLYTYYNTSMHSIHMRAKTQPPIHSKTLPEAADAS